MRPLILFFSLFFILNYSFSQIDLTNGLVAHLTFDYNPDDISGFNNHGVVNGAVLTTDHSFQSNKAYQFDGVPPMALVFTHAATETAEVGLMFE